MKFRDFILRRAFQTVVTILIVLVLMFVLFRAMPSDPVEMTVDPKWGPLQKHQEAVRLGFERDGTSAQDYKGQATQDTVTGNLSFLAQDLVKSKYARVIPVGSGTLWFEVNLTWNNGQVNRNDDLVLGLFLDGRGASAPDGKPQEDELVRVSHDFGADSRWPANLPSYHRQVVGIERPREQIYDQNTYIFVVCGYNLTGTVDFTAQFKTLYIVQISMWEQFVIYIKNMLTLDFGRSFYTQVPVMDELGSRVGTTLLLFGTASMIGPIFGIGGGVLLAWKRGTKAEIGAIIGLLFFYSMPVFWLGMIMLSYFGYTMKLFPIGGMVTQGVNYQGLAYVADVLHHMALPLITMMIAGLAGGMLLMRNSMLEVVGEDYIVTARAKGLTERKVMYKHAARNAMLPVVTSIAMGVGGAISGGVLTETIFNWPGVGRYLVTSTLTQDFPVVQATFFILALITITSNVVADILYAYLDPRVRI